MTLHATCHCGAVRIEMARRPRTLTECNCSICRRYAARWAYTTLGSVRIHHPPGGVGRYLFRTKTFEYHFCRRCGCVMYYRRIHTRHPDRIAVNARMMDPADIASIPVRALDVRKKR